MNTLRFTLVLIFLCTILIGCKDSNDQETNDHNQELRLATTTSTVQSGLLDVLIPAFEAKTHIKTIILAKGTGQSLKLAAEGKADVVLVHAREAEDKFITDGYGVNRRDVMYNDFIVLGPTEDPAKIKGEANVVVALRKIAESNSPFVSRGDNSGTQIREKELWSLVGIVPQGVWYLSSGGGMLKTLEEASTRKAYVLSDRSTYLFHRGDLSLQILSEGDQRLWNPYGVIAVNPIKVGGTNFQAAMQFVDFLVSEEGQDIIRSYGVSQFGAPLFTPLAIP